jgi:hypothetical protein
LIYIDYQTFKGKKIGNMFGDAELSSLESFLQGLSDCEHGSDMSTLISKIGHRVRLSDPILRVNVKRKDKETIGFEFDFVERSVQLEC